MNSERWQKVKGLFDAIVELPPQERKQFLDNSCGTDATLRREVENLLASFDDAGSFMEQPASKEVASLIIARAETLEPGRSFGHYEIIEQLGAGGMGEVYLAHDARLKRKVALKVLPAELVSKRERLHRFEQEARAASALNHPNIITIHEIGVEGDTHFIATEFIEGETLRRKLQTTRLEIEETLNIAIQIAAALEVAHRSGIVHRDIKPENLMLREDGLVKVLDFGLAKLTQEKTEGVDTQAPTCAQITQAGMILGTVAYMSPEQARGKELDSRTDIFSFGVVLYEMLTNHSPFAGDSTSDVIASILKTEPAPLASFDVPKELGRIVNKALRKNTAERYQHIKDLLIDLKDFKQDSEFEAKLERQKFEDTSASADRFDFYQNANAKTQILEVNSTMEASDETAPANTAGPPATKHTGQLRRILSTRRAIYAAVLITLVLGALVYVRRWRQTSVTPTAQIKSLAVLPLKSLDAGENYLGLGIADAVIRRINQTGKLIVRPTSAVRRYLNEETDALTAARQLNADAVLEGSVQRADDRLRVSVNLLRTSDGASLWADSFDMRMTDIFTIQDTVAQQVAARLRLQLDPSQQASFMKRNTSNPIAYEFYVKGVYSFDQRGWGDKDKPQAEATIDLFKKAIEVDPNNALAHAQLAYAYAWMAQFIEPTEPAWVERAKEEINRAQAIDPQLAETHIARHFILRTAYEGWQIEAAIRELLVAQQLDPNTGHDQLGVLYMHIGLEDLAEREKQRALDIDPTSEYVKKTIINNYVNLNRYDEGLAAEQKFFGGNAGAWYLLGKGRLDDAQTQIEQALAKEPDNLNMHRLKGILLALRGDFRTAEAEIPFLLSRRSVKNFAYHHLAYDIACIYALAGKSNEAVKWLRETAATGFPCYPLFERDPYLNRIRQATEFVQFMAEMKAQFEKYKLEFATTL